MLVDGFSVRRGRALGRMVGTVPRVHAARSPFGWVHIGVRHLQLHTEDQLKHQQHGSHPVCEPIAHDPEGYTPGHVEKRGAPLR
jgi:hypothetical protein